MAHDSPAGSPASSSRLAAGMWYLARRTRPRGELRTLLCCRRSQGTGPPLCAGGGRGGSHRNRMEPTAATSTSPIAASEICAEAAGHVGNSVGNPSARSAVRGARWERGQGGTGLQPAAARAGSGGFSPPPACDFWPLTATDSRPGRTGLIPSVSSPIDAATAVRSQLLAQTHPNGCRRRRCGRRSAPASSKSAVLQPSAAGPGARRSGRSRRRGSLHREQRKEARCAQHSR